MNAEIRKDPKCSSRNQFMISQDIKDRAEECLEKYLEDEDDDHTNEKYLVGILSRYISKRYYPGSRIKFSAGSGRVIVPLNDHECKSFSPKDFLMWFRDSDYYEHFDERVEWDGDLNHKWTVHDKKF